LKKTQCRCGGPSEVDYNLKSAAEHKMPKNSEGKSESIHKNHYSRRDPYKN
jgi:hypothetical protein